MKRVVLELRPPAVSDGWKKLVSPLVAKDNYLSDLGVPTCGHGDFIPENVFYRLAMKANSHVDPEDKDRWQITTPGPNEIAHRNLLRRNTTMITKGVSEIPTPGFPTCGDGTPP